MKQAYLQLAPTSQTVCRQLKSLLNPEIRHFYIKIFGQLSNYYICDKIKYYSSQLYAIGSLVL